MKMLLTEQQVKRLIELLKQNQASGADEELIRKVLIFLQGLKQMCQRTTKGGSDWLVIRIGKFSILLGKKK